MEKSNNGRLVKEKRLAKREKRRNLPPRALELKTLFVPKHLVGIIFIYTEIGNSPSPNSQFLNSTKRTGIYLKT